MYKIKIELSIQQSILQSHDATKCYRDMLAESLTMDSEEFPQSVEKDSKMVLIFETLFGVASIL